MPEDSLLPKKTVQRFVPAAPKASKGLSTDFITSKSSPWIQHFISILQNGYQEINKKLNVFSRKPSQKTNKTIKIIQTGQKITLKRLELVMRDSFILSRLYTGDITVFTNTIRSIRALISKMQSSPKTADDCKKSITELQTIQKDLVHWGSQYNAVIHFFEKEPKNCVIAETIKAETHHIFDHCNHLIQKINTIEHTLSQK